MLISQNPPSIWIEKRSLHMHLNLILKSSPSIWIEIDKHLKLGGVEESRVYTIYIYIYCLPRFPMFSQVAVE